MATDYDKFNILAQLEHLQSKYQGTGNADTTKWDWALNIHRDTLASHVDHYNRLAFFAIAKNESIEYGKSHYAREGLIQSLIISLYQAIELVEFLHDYLANFY